MKKSYLFPNYFKKIGYAITIPFLLILILNACNVPYLNFDFKTFGIICHKGASVTVTSNNVEVNLTHSIEKGEGDNVNVQTTFETGKNVWFTTTKTDFQATVVPIILIIGLLFIAFSKEKIEDEMIVKIREQSLVWAVMVNFIILIFGILLIFGLSYLHFLSLQIFLILILFIAKFNFELFRFKKVTKDEE
jgi:type IV secretory pathway VirB2 component (pilin)